MESLFLTFVGDEGGGNLAKATTLFAYKAEYSGFSKNELNERKVWQAGGWEEEASIH